MLFSNLLSFSLAAASVAFAHQEPTRTHRRDTSHHPDTTKDYWVLSKRRAPSFNPTPDDILKARENDNSVEWEPMTNGKRMALGLPPLPPVRRSHGVGEFDKRSGNHPRPSASAVATPGHHKKGVLKAYTGGVFLGYVSTAFNEFGESFFTEEHSKALLVQVDSTTQTSNIKALNFDDSKWKYLGGIVGFANSNANIGKGSYNYGYFGGVNASPKGSVPMNAGNSFTKTTGILERSESLIWTHHHDGSVTAQWINKDHSKPKTILAYTQGTFCFTGDIDVFRKTFGPTKRIHLKFQSV